MPSTTTQAPTVTAEDAPSPPARAGQARTARATAARAGELTLCNALCDQAVPLTAMTTWERHQAGYPPRDAGERARYREFDQSAARPGAEMEAGQ
jgi:hypothetical protein